MFGSVTKEQGHGEEQSKTSQLAEAREESFELPPERALACLPRNFSRISPSQGSSPSLLKEHQEPASVTLPFPAVPIHSADSNMPPPPKRRKITTTAVEEISFDPSARQDYLTGFHKRKIERTNAARAFAVKKEREERIAQRKKLREERKADLERHVKEVNALINPQAAVGENGIEDSESESVADGKGEENQEVIVEPMNHEAEYIDEDKYTSVVVEEMDVTREGLRKANEADEDDDTAGHEPERNRANIKKKRVWTKNKPKDVQSKPREKKKKFRYESKSERKVSREKQRSKNRAQAKARREK